MYDTVSYYSKAVCPDLFAALQNGFLLHNLFKFSLSINDILESKSYYILFFKSKIALTKLHNKCILNVVLQSFGHLRDSKLLQVYEYQHN
jgi:hypothetical protein